MTHTHSDTMLCLTFSLHHLQRTPTRKLQGDIKEEEDMFMVKYVQTVRLEHATS